jgi:hypothetical protein
MLHDCIAATSPHTNVVVSPVSLTTPIIRLPEPFWSLTFCILIVKYGFFAGSVLGLDGTVPMVIAHVLHGVLVLWKMIISTWLHLSGAGDREGVFESVAEGDADICAVAFLVAFAAVAALDALGG